MDEDGELFRLVEIVKDLLINKKVYLIQNDDQKLNTDYWIRLAPKAVQYGAGVIKLFIDETEYQARLGKSEPELNWWQKAQVFIQDLFGIGEEVPDLVATPTTSHEPLPEPKPARFPDGGPAVQPLEQPLENPIESSLPESSSDRKGQEQSRNNQGEVKGESIEKKQREDKGGSTVVSGPKTGDGGGASRPDTQEPAQVSVQPPTPPEPPSTEPEDTTPPDVLIESLTYNYASSSLFLEWSSPEIPSVSFDVEYKKDDSDWQNLLASTSETQTSLSVDIQDIIYYFRVRATDSVGNQSNWQESSIEILSKPVVINEIAWMGTIADVNDEWIELYNQADYDIDLNDWVLESSDGTPTINLIGNISSYSYFLLERTDDETISNIPADGIYSGAMNNEGEKFQLKDNKGNIIDQVDCEINWYAGDKDDDRTMERVNPAAPGTDSQNWQTYIGLGSSVLDADNNPIFGTPKAQNSVYDANPPTKINDLAISDSLGTFLVLQWTAPSDEKSSLSLTYDMHYASESISEENWVSMSQIIDIPLVENPDTIQIATISGLKYDTTYYFAIKTIDGLNISEISNILIYSTGAPPTLAKSAWPVFQRDVGHTGFSPYQGPDFIASSSVNIKWIATLDAAVYVSSAIGLDGTIYVGDIMGKFYAINPINGEVKWSYDTYNYDLGRGGIYSSAAVASDGTIYFSVFGSYLYALTPNGKLKWKYQIGGPNTSGSSPVIGSNGIIYLTGGNTVYAINPDGTLKWSYYVMGSSVSAPAMASDETVFVSWGGSYFTGGLIAIDSEGNLKWSSEQRSIITGQALAIGSGDVIYVGFSPGEHAPLKAINPADGSEIWSCVIGEMWNSAAITLSGKIYAVIHNGALYVISPDGNGEWIFSAGGLVSSSPIIDPNEVIYFGAEDKKIYAVNSDGTLKWSYELSDAVYSSPIMDQDGTIYVTTIDGKVYAIGD